MDQAPDRSVARPNGGVSPATDAWDSYYKEASRRRRAAGGFGNLRVEKRRRRLRERLAIGVSALLVGVMTLIFYLVLARR